MHTLPLEIIQSARFGAVLVGVQLPGAKLRDVKLFSANLTGANLVGADLSNASLNGANLTAANLRGAILVGADLSRAKCAGADFTGANLTRCVGITYGTIHQADLRGAKGVLRIPSADDSIVVNADGRVYIGCQGHPIDYWRTHAKSLWNGPQK